jgi:hypothetical protein
MPSDDLVLNVRQIAGYPPSTTAPPASTLLLQLAGLGGPYASISPAALVGTALSQGGDMAIAGSLSALAFSGGSAQFSNASANVLWAQKASVVNFNASFGTINCVQIATVDDLSALNAALRATTVWSFNGRVGDVGLWIDDIICAGGAPIFSPRFQGEPRACTPPPTSNSSRLATTAFVTGAIGGITATYAPLDSPAFTGIPTAPTAPQGSADGQLATTAFVINAVADSTTGVASFNGRTGVVALVGGDITGAGGALLASPVFTGTPSAPTQPSTDNSTRLATTAFVVAVAAPLASPAFTGVPTGPTAPPSTSTTQLATTAFVTAAIAAGMAGIVTTFNGRAGAVNLIANDVSAAGGALLASPAFTGTPTAPTAAPSTANTQLATCAFVMAAVATGGGVLTFNGRAGAVTLTAADVSAVGGALLASPAFTGLPTAPTAGAGTNTAQLATCAFVAAAVAAATAGVASFNGRTGAVSLIATDVTAVLPASTTPPVMNGTASAGTQAAWSRGDHVHPVDTSRYAATNPSNFQTAAQVTASLANYLPLSGGTLTGGLTTTGGLLAGGGAVTAQGSSPAFNCLNSGGTQVGSFFWNGVALYMQTFGATPSAAWIDASGTFNTSFKIASAVGYTSKAGSSGAFGGNNWNFNWTGSALACWIDTVDAGNVGGVTSDYRTKRNVTDLPSTWERTKALRPVSYQHRDYTPPGLGADQGDVAPRPLFVGDDVERWGFVAHELQETLIPNAATGEKDSPTHIQSPNPWTVIATLTKALQEAMTRIEALEAA